MLDGVEDSSKLLATVGDIDGDDEDDNVGNWVGCELGKADFIIDGFKEGTKLGTADFCIDGMLEGYRDGKILGSDDNCSPDSIFDGAFDGTNDGAFADPFDFFAFPFNGLDPFEVFDTFDDTFDEIYCPSRFVADVLDDSRLLFLNLLEVSFSTVWTIDELEKTIARNKALMNILLVNLLLISFTI